MSSQTLTTPPIEYVPLTTEREHERRPAARTLFWPELAKLPRPEYLIKGVIERGCLAEIFGPTSCGKSFLATDLGLHVAAGSDWHGHRVRQAGVLYVNAEGGHAIVNRLDAFRRHHEIELDDLAFGVVIEPTTLLEATGVDQVIADAGAVPDLGVVAIDTAARVMPGGDEGAETMSVFVAACDRIRAATGAAVVVIHHSGKDTARGSRGSTVLPFGADTVIEVTRDTVSSIATATINKQRDGATGSLFHFSLETIELDTDADGDPITSCVVVPTDRKPAKAMTPKQRRALNALNDVAADHGAPAPDQRHYPPGAVVVDVSLWREHLFKTGILDPNASNPRADFKRLKDQLAERGHIGEWNELLWTLGNT